MGKSDNVVMILVIAVAAFLFMRYAKDPTGLRTLYKDTEKYITEKKDAAWQTVNPVSTDPCDPYRLYNYVAYLGCKAGIIGNTPEQGGEPGYYTSPAKCPYDSSLLIGDRRCSMPTPGEQTLQTGTSPFTGQPWIPSGGWL